MLRSQERPWERKNTTAGGHEIQPRTFSLFFLIKQNFCKKQYYPVGNKGTGEYLLHRGREQKNTLHLGEGQVIRVQNHSRRKA